MTKIYQGGDTYHLHMISGKVFDVTDEELNEIAEESPIVEDLREALDEHKASYSAAEKLASKITSSLEEIESYITSEREDVDLDEVLRLVQAVKELAEDI